MEKPEGLRLLEGPRQTEEDTKSCLAQCCGEHPVCEFEKQCQKLYDKRATADYRVGGWSFPSGRLDKKEGRTYTPDIERYANSLPVLSSSISVFARERVLRLG